MNERAESRRVTEILKRAITKAPTYVRRLREFVEEKPIGVGTAIAAVVVGTLGLGLVDWGITNFFIDNGPDRDFRYTGRAALGIGLSYIASAVGLYVIAKSDNSQNSVL